MKSQKGITLTSLAIYIVLIFVVLAILATVTLNFQSGVKQISSEGTEIAEINKFNMYFLQEVKKQGNAINTISDNEILFTMGNKYTFKDDNKIYLNDNIKISENIETCRFSNSLVNGKMIITVKIKAKNAEEQTIEYVLSNEISEENYEDQAEYTSYVSQDWDVSKLNSKIPVYLETIDNKTYLVPIPKGFVISGAMEEKTIENGLVIYQMTEEEKATIDWTDSTEMETVRQAYNQFVWIPVEEFTTTYTTNTTYLEPSNLTWKDSATGFVFDSQNELDYYYGTNYYNFTTDFNYSSHYNEMVESVNKYNGFYMGRYETTIDEDKNIGSKANLAVLTSDEVLEEIDSAVYYYRWWGLYYSHRNNNIEGNGEYIVTSMVWGQQWDAMVDFLGTEQVEKTLTTNQTEVVESGESVDANGTKDILNNIYDLRGNVYDWTAERSDAARRTSRSANFGSTYSYTPADRHDIYSPIDTFNDLRN